MLIVYNAAKNIYLFIFNKLQLIIELAPQYKKLKMPVGRQTRQSALSSRHLQSLT